VILLGLWKKWIITPIFVGLKVQYQSSTCQFRLIARRFCGYTVQAVDNLVMFEIAFETCVNMKVSVDPGLHHETRGRSITLKEMDIFFFLECRRFF